MYFFQKIKTMNQKIATGIGTLIIIIIAITAGVFVWLYEKDRLIEMSEYDKKFDKVKVAEQRIDKIKIDDFSIAVEENGQLIWSDIADVKSGVAVYFRLMATDVDFCNVTGGTLFDSGLSLSANEADIKKQTNDFSGGTYTLNCVRNSDNKTVSKSITLDITPANKLVMCMKKCGSSGVPVAKNMSRFLGETVQKIRACFGSYSTTCPSQDVTDKANWTSANPDVAYWTKDLVYPEKTFKNVYPKKTFITEKMGTSTMKVEYKGYSYSVDVAGKMVGQ